MANLKISQLTAKGSKIATTDRVAIAQDDGGGNFSSKYVTGEQLFGYKKYVATISQTGTSAPSVTVLENTLGGTVVWTRGGVGLYNGYLAGAFVNQNKNYLMINNPTASLSVVELKWGTIDDITITTYDTSFVTTDGLLSFNTIEIRVYP